MRRVLLAAAVVALVVTVCAGAGAQAATVRVLVVKVTWGAEPFTDAQVDAALGPAASFFATASFGRVSLRYAQTPWLHVLAAPPVCDAPELPARLAQLAAGAGYDPAPYDRTIYLFPAVPTCPFSGAYAPAGILLDGQLGAGLVIHELGHSFGMGHAGALVCRYRASSRFCRGYVYGDPWDVMGAGWDVYTPGAVAPSTGDFGALQKARAGWSTELTRVDRAGTYELGPVEEASTAAQALVIRTAAFEYWVDHREAVGNDAYLAGDRSGVTSGFEVHRSAGVPDIPARTAFPLVPDYLLPQGRQNRYVTTPGESFALPSVFRLTALTRSDGVMSVRFAWLDRTRPAPPRLHDDGTAISWPVPHDTGTGVRVYLVSLDGAAPAAQAARTVNMPLLAPGTHAVRVAAVDYAGNVSPPATLRFSR